jgi:AraC-like DNA-binding protein
MRAIQEHVSHPNQSFRFLQLELAAFGGALHRHHQLELTWVEQGAGMRLVGDSAEPFGPGDLVLLGENVPHLWFGAPPAGQSIAVATVLQFPPELLAHAALPELHRLAPLAQRAACGLLIDGTCRDAVTVVLRQMRQASELARLAGLMQIFALLADATEQIRPLASRPSPSATGSRVERRIDRVIDWVHGHLADELDVAAAARIAHVTPAAFSRFFHREVGKTFTRYLNDLRCSQACLQLRQTAKPVALIAAECGFTSAAHFNRQFRARQGLTPREYRQRV